MFSMKKDSAKIRTSTPQVPLPRFLELLMPRNFIVVTGAAVLLGLTIACTSNSSTPLTPTTPNANVTGSTADDGSTLKVTAPVPQSPVNGQKPATARLVVSNSTAQ